MSVFIKKKKQINNNKIKEDKANLFKDLFYLFLWITKLSDIEKEDLLKNKNFLNSQNFIKDSGSEKYYDINEQKDIIWLFFIILSIVFPIFFLLIFSFFWDDIYYILFIAWLLPIISVLIIAYYWATKINSFIYTKFYNVYYKKPKNLIPRYKWNDMNLRWFTSLKSEADFNKIMQEKEKNNRKYFNDNFIIIKKWN